MISFLALIEVGELFAFKTTVTQLIIQQDNGLLTWTGWQYPFQFINWITSAIVEKRFVKTVQGNCYVRRGKSGLSLSLHFLFIFSLQSFDMCFWNFFFQKLFRFLKKIGFCFCKLNCVLGKLFSFWEINLCFGKLIYVLGKWFVFWVKV